MKQQLKVLFICPTVACYIGGTETVVSQLVRRLKDKVHLALLSGTSGHGKQPLIDADGFELLILPFVGRDSKLNRTLSKVLMTSPFKIESYSFFRALAAYRVDLASYDYIVTFYEADAYLLSKRYPSLQERYRHFLPGVSIRRFFKHVPPSDVVFFGYRAAEKVRKKWGVNILSLPLGVDSQFFPTHAPIYPPTRRLVYLGRLDRSKHVDWLADLFERSELSQRGYHLDIVGDGPLLNDLLAKYGRSKSMTFHGRKRQEEVVEILRRAFILLHPTDHESFGLTILEAMAAGVPVITHGLGSIKVWAKDCPRYAAHLDSASWINEIRKFEQSPYWEAVSTASMAHARSFTWDRVATGVLELITAPQSHRRAE